MQKSERQVSASLTFSDILEQLQNSETLNSESVNYHIKVYWITAVNI